MFEKDKILEFRGISSYNHIVIISMTMKQERVL